MLADGRVLGGGVVTFHVDCSGTKLLETTTTVNVLGVFQCESYLVYMMYS